MYECVVCVIRVFVCIGSLCMYVYMCVVCDCVIYVCMCVSCRACMWLCVSFY